MKAKTLAQRVGVGGAVGVVCGVASALFLAALERATDFRNVHEEIVYCLPLAGIIIGLAYERWGKAISGGNNLVLDSMHAAGAAGERVDGSAQLPIRMAPMVLVGTVLTHLFGGSAGREGTAVQMGASLADEISHRLRVSKETRRQLLAAGIAGGFGSVFGTPVAGAIFGLEVACIGHVEYRALLPALVASVVGDYVTRHLGVVHTAYPASPYVALTVSVFAKLCIIALAMALAAVAFIELTRGLKRFLERRIKRLPLRMFAGGLTVVIMWKLLGTSDYLGLGVPMILRAFSDPSLPAYAFAAKLVLTAVTLASGFVGGEVTPLFFIGATLGSVVARSLGLPIALGASVGLAAVFGAAANTPIALSIMAVELFGGFVFPHVVIVSALAYLLSGHRGIYSSQRIARRKHGGKPFDKTITLAEHEARSREPR